MTELKGLWEVKRGFKTGLKYVDAANILVKDQNVLSSFGLTVTYSSIYWALLGYLVSGISNIITEGIHLKDGKGVVFKLSTPLDSWAQLEGDDTTHKVLAVLKPLLPILAIGALLLPAVIYCFQTYMALYQTLADALLAASGKRVSSVDPGEEGYAGLVWLLMFLQLQVIEVGMPIISNSFFGDSIESIGGNIALKLWKALGVLMSAFLNGFYAFDNNWRARGFAADKRFKMLGSQACYYMGFGLPLALLCAYIGTTRGFMGGFGTFLVLFPIHIPLAAASNNFSDHKAKPIFFVTFFQALAKAIGGCNSRSTTSATIVASAGSSHRRRTRSSVKKRSSSRSSSRTARTSSRSRPRRSAVR